MGEPRRIELMPVGPVNTEKKKKKEVTTVRFDLQLTETTDLSCPEFSYSDLVHKSLVSWL